MKELKIDDLRAVKSEEVKEPTPHEKAAQIEKEAVRALSVDENKGALTKSTYGAIKFRQKGKFLNELERDLVILKTECSELKNENRRLKESIDQTNGQLRVRNQEVVDLKKTISKMQQMHEAEVQDLKDQLGETQAALTVAEKSKTEACRERNELIDAAEDDDDRFQEILALAVVLERGARSMQELSRMLQEKTER